MADIETLLAQTRYFAETTAPATPAAGSGVIYVKSSDKKLYLKDSTGTETDLTAAGGGGSVATDAIFDAKGDLAVGTGADTASRLAVGTNGHVLTADSAEATGLKWAAAAGGMSNPMTTSGDIIYGGASGTPTRLAAGTDGHVLKLASGVPSWAAESGGGSFDPDVHMSRRILILPQLQPPDTTPQGTWAGSLDINNENVLYSFLRTQATTIGARLFYNSTQAQNDECTWSVPLAAGTWTVRFYGRKSANTGIITCEIDGSSVGTVDTYAAAPARLEGSITGITVATTGLKALGILMATKNASSSSYYVQLDAIELQRTA